MNEIKKPGDPRSPGFLRLPVMVMVATALDHNHLLVVAAMPSAVAVHVSVRIAIPMMMVHSALLDHDGLRAGGNRGRESECRSGCNNLSKFFHRLSSDKVRRTVASGGCSGCDVKILMNDRSN